MIRWETRLVGSVHEQISLKPSRPKPTSETGPSHLGGETLVPEVRHDGVGQSDCIFAVDLVGL